MVDISPKLENLHHEAMTLSAQAFCFRIQGNDSDANTYIKQAFEKEREVAISFIENYELEPTRSVLFRSAASLAIDCDELREAEKLICFGLSGNPPMEIADELRDLLEQVNWKRHLDVKGVSLTDNAFQMSLTGESVGFGIVQSNQYLSRVKSMESLIYRSEERRRNLPFRKRGASKLKKDIELYVSVPRAASFAATIQIGSQLTIPGINLTDSLIQYLFDSLSMFSSLDIEGLKNFIDNDEYFGNFLQLAKSIAPDGKNIKTVGLTSFLNGSENRIIMSIPRNQIETLDFEDKDELSNYCNDEYENIVIEGELLVANSLSRDKKFHVIKIRSADSKIYKINVPLAQMNDIVKPLYGEMVTVEGLRKNSAIFLRNIYLG